MFAKKTFNFVNAEHHAARSLRHVKKISPKLLLRSKIQKIRLLRNY